MSKLTKSAGKVFHSPEIEDKGYSHLGNIVAHCLEHKC